jgi:predicted house-cleaning noncanonical NTP pyrophosphatase (MazG superfamily)
MKFYNKLVRDNIPEIIAAKGEGCKTRIATPEEYRAKLIEKLEEEVAEFTRDPSAEELADIMEVVQALAFLLESTPEEIEKIRIQKANERGGFVKRIILEES